MPLTSSGPRAASAMALRSASAPIERVLRPEWREYGVSPTPTMQYLSLRPVTGPYSLRNQSRRVEFPAGPSERLARGGFRTSTIQPWVPARSNYDVVGVARRLGPAWSSRGL